ncbi:MAG TPA: organic hydroperoxide resistance protein [Solirubrobacteraceae bacterium]
MARVLYTAEATATGGRGHGHGVSSDGLLDVQLRAPAELGGEGDGTNPEQLFAVGYAACFDNALDRIAQREKVEAGTTEVTAKVSLVPGVGEGRRFELAVELDVSLPGVEDPDVAARLVAAAHQVCPYSNATRGNVEVTLKANGRAVAD